MPSVAHDTHEVSPRASTADLPAPSFAVVMTYIRVTLPRAGLTPREETVAWTIASHYNQREGIARPSYDCLAAEMNLSKDSIWRAVRAITRAGVWAVKAGNGRGHASEYRFPLAGYMGVAERSANPADVPEGRSAEPADLPETDERSAEPADVSGERSAEPADVPGVSLSTRSAGPAGVSLSTRSAESPGKVRGSRDERSAGFADPTETRTETYTTDAAAVADEVAVERLALVRSFPPTVIVERTEPPWVAEGIKYGAWVRRERAAGRLAKHNPPREQ